MRTLRSNCFSSLIVILFLFAAGFSQAYGIKSHLQMDKKTASLFAVTFWASYVLGKILNCLANFLFSQKSLLAFFLMLSIISNVLLIEFVFKVVKGELFLFIYLALFGLASSPLFGYSMSLPGRHFPLSHRYTFTMYDSIFLISGTLGIANHSLLVALLMQKSSNYFIIYLTALSIIFTLFACILPYLFRKLLTRKESITIVTISNQNNL